MLYNPLGRITGNLIQEKHRKSRIKIYSTTSGNIYESAADWENIDHKRDRCRGHWSGCNAARKDRPVPSAGRHRTSGQKLEDLFPPGKLDYYLDHAYAFIVGNKLFQEIIGGEHSVSFDAIRTFAKYVENLTLLKNQSIY